MLVEKIFELAPDNRVKRALRVLANRAKDSAGLGLRAVNLLTRIPLRDCQRLWEHIVELTDRVNAYRKQVEDQTMEIALLKKRETIVDVIDREYHDLYGYISIAFGIDRSRVKEKMFAWAYSQSLNAGKLTAEELRSALAKSARYATGFGTMRQAYGMDVGKEPAVLVVSVPGFTRETRDKLFPGKTPELRVQISVARDTDMDRAAKVAQDVADITQRHIHLLYPDGVEDVHRPISEITADAVTKRLREELKSLRGDLDSNLGATLRQVLGQVNRVKPMKDFRTQPEMLDAGVLIFRNNLIEAEAPAPWTFEDDPTSHGGAVKDKTGKVLYAYRSSFSIKNAEIAERRMRLITLAVNARAGYQPK